MLPALGAQSLTQPSVGFIPPATLIPESITTSVGYWTLAGSVSQPVLDIPRLLFNAKAEDARMEQAVIAYEKTVQTAYGEAENALVALDAGKRAVKILFDGEAHAHRAYDAAQRRYAMGLDDLTTALTTEQAWSARPARRSPPSRRWRCSGRSRPGYGPWGRLAGAGQSSRSRR